MPKCLAFKHAVTIGLTGEVRPCCAWRKGGSGVKIDDDWQTLHNEYYEKSLDNWLPECLECQQDEESNGRSMRKWMNKELENASGTEFFDLKINNTCNLSCVSCDSYSSSTWGTITGNVGNRQIGWHKEIAHIYPQLISAKHIKFTGGEPFMIPQVKKIIKYLIDAGVSSKIKLKFVTNGTIDITSYYPLFELFEHVNIIASVDAIGERFEYLRRGAIWEQASNNIIDMQNSSPNNTEVSITCLPSVLNINNIHEVSDWATSHGIYYCRASDLITPAFMAPHASLDEQDNRQQLIDHVMILDDRDGKDYKKWL
jgi:MoaA/NifB/PqqE/SkfB family radical SAM enzyme